jgi:hypothetical protein
MTRVRIAGAALVVLLGAGLFVRITNRATVQPRKAEAVSVLTTGMTEAPPDIVDPKTGNIHLQIPILAPRQKTAGPPAGH